MFVYTARFSKKKLLTAVLIAAAVICALIVIIAVSSGSRGKAVTAPDMRNNADRVSYLNSLGWIVEETPLESRTVVIPRSFEGIYADYIALQREQGFPLEDYGGMEATRYTYRVKNWQDSSKEVVADILVYGMSVIGGDIQCPAADGFMTALKP